VVATRAQRAIDAGTPKLRGRRAAGELAAVKAGPRYPIESVDNALKLLLLFQDRSSLSVAQASDYLGVARSTAHRLLAMLEHHRLVQQDPVQRTYLPGPGLIDLGLGALRDLDVRATVQPFLRELVEEVGETVHFVARKGRDVLFLDSVESPKALRVGSRTGEIMPAHATAGGKAILAALDPLVLNELYPEPALPDVTGRTITNRGVLFTQLATARRIGYTVNKGESEAGISAVAAVIKGADGNVFGALTVAGPTSRLTDQAIASISRPLRACTARIGDELSRLRGVG
jgi:DNA-binding IclR family transcriptional regulator